MVKNKAYKFRLYPNEEQKVLFSKTFGCVRFVYNHYLAMRKTAYDTEKKSITYNQCASDLVQFKKDNAFLKEIDSIALQQSLRHLDIAYQNFFRDKSVGFPKFKSKKNNHFSYSTVSVNGNIKLEDKEVILPKLKTVRIKKHRHIPDTYKLKSATISQEPSGKYYISILFEYEEETVSVVPLKGVGLDFSMKELFVSSYEELQGNYPKYFRQMEKKLAREQRKLSHCMKGSNNYNKQKIKVAKIHEKISFQRKDFLHKISWQITNAYDYVCIEDLNMKGMSQALNFGKSVADNGWGMFTTFLAYKLSDSGKYLVKVNKWFPSSKTCHCCGYKYSELTLKERIWTCQSCGTILDRDENASINILGEGTKILNETLLVTA
jgi:putative transposase